MERQLDHTGDLFHVRAIEVVGNRWCLGERLW
jgi:hypothetical protein